VRRLCAPVPDDVELGFHLCYGDYGAKHFIEPQDTARLVQMANALSAAIAHVIAYIHMPVPVTRADDAYFQPLTGLQLRSGTEIYLGLVHAADGADGTRKRIETARRYLSDFGIASECGMARARTPDVVEHLLKIHAEVTSEPA
jgi:methionine synthase II (cobalamin-independent)